MDIARDGAVVRVVVGRLEHHLPILQHLQQLVHLNGVQLADLVQKQHAALCLGHGARLGLGNTLLSQCAGSLVDRIMDRPDQGIGDRAFIEPDGGGVHLNEGGVLAEGGSPGLLRRLQHQTRRAGLADAGRAVDDDVLRVGAAENGLQRTDAILLPDDVLHLRGADMLREGLRQMNGPHGLQLLHFPAGFPAHPGLGPLLLPELAIEIDAHDHRHRQLNEHEDIAEHLAITLLLL